MTAVAETFDAVAVAKTNAEALARMATEMEERRVAMNAVQHELDTEVWPDAVRAEKKRLLASLKARHRDLFHGRQQLSTSDTKIARLHLRERAAMEMEFRSQGDEAALRHLLHGAAGDVGGGIAGYRSEAPRSFLIALGRHGLTPADVEIPLEHARQLAADRQRRVAEQLSSLGIELG